MSFIGFMCLASPRLITFYGSQPVDDALKQFPRIDSVAESGRVFTDIAVKIHIIVLRVEGEEFAVYFERVTLLAEPVEKPDGIFFNSVKHDIPKFVAS